jgi:hypothetical protein
MTKYAAVILATLLVASPAAYAANSTWWRLSSDGASCHATTSINDATAHFMSGFFRTEAECDQARADAQQQAAAAEAAIKWWEAPGCTAAALTPAYYLVAFKGQITKDDGTQVAEELMLKPISAQPSAE